MRQKTVKRPPPDPADIPLQREAGVCPLSRVQVGTCVRIKQLCASPDLCQRMRELGLCEEQQVKLLLQNHNFVCQVCNVRLGISAQLADSIWVEPLASRKPAA